MLRLLSIRNFVVVEALDLELDRGFTVLTGETGAGKSILLDALALLLGDRFEQRQLRPGADRAELAAGFDVGDRPDVAAWLAEQGLGGGGDAGDAELLVRRTLDAQGRSRAWINGRPATLAQLSAVGEMLVDLHGQHAHQSLLAADAQRALVDAFGGFAVLAREVAAAWRAWRAAVEKSDAAASAAAAFTAERELLEARRRELAALNVTAARVDRAHAGAVAPRPRGVAARGGERGRGGARRKRRLARAPPVGASCRGSPRGRRTTRRWARSSRCSSRRGSSSSRPRASCARTGRSSSSTRPSSRASRSGSPRSTTRRAGFRVRPEGLPELLAETEARLAAIAESADVARLAKRAAEAEATLRALADQLSKKRQFAASELAHRVTAAMQELAMAGGRFEIALTPLPAIASYGQEQVEFRVAGHPKQPLGPLARVASGGELSRVALAVQVVTSEVGAVPTLVFDEVDAGIGGAVAATVGRLMQSLGARRQVLCVTHLPQVAAFADANFRVSKHGDGEIVRAEVEPLSAAERVEELARMLAGGAITAKTRAHARELLDSGRRRC